MTNAQYKHVVWMLTAIILILAVVSTGTLLHIEDVNSRQDTADSNTCKRGNRLRAVLHADGKEHAIEGEPLLLSREDMERIVPIVDCETNTPLSVAEQRAYVHRVTGR